MTRRTGRRSALILAGLWLAGGLPAGARPLPRLVCVEPEFRFGAQPNTGEVRHVFVLANEGDARLDIERVSTDCGCTVARPGDVLIPPGARMDLEVRLFLKGRSGPQSHRVVVESSDPAAPRLVLRLTGEAVAEVLVVPDRLYWGNLKRDTDAARTVDLEFHESAPRQVTGARSDLPAFAVEVEPRLPGRRYRLRVRPVCPLAPGRFEGALTVDLDPPRRAPLVIPMQGRVVDAVFVVPESLWLAPDPARAPVSRLLVVQSSERRPFGLGAVEPPQPGAEVRVSPSLSGGYRIELRNLRPDPGLDGRELVIPTDCPAVPEIRVPIRVGAPPPLP